MKNLAISALLIVAILCQFTLAQEKETDKVNHFSGLKWRTVGPAVTSGRIADFAVNPTNFSEYYVAVASGNIWKTTNAGTTFEPIFDTYGAYAIGCIKIDPSNPNVVWTGTGENNHQRALGYGDGVYKSEDGGASWTNMGLKESRQIGGIVIHPKDSRIVYVAAEGSVWGPGGERGLYKTVDGGKTWKKILNISEHTGVNNIIMDPRDPNTLYATSEQRRRHVFTKIGGGPESAVYKSIDAGETWEKIMKGLPSVDIGGMGIDISPVNPDVLYLIVEAAEDKGGFFRSTNRGASWEKMSDHSSSGQYYNEIFCDPNDIDKIFSVETFSHVTTDGGKTWKRLSIKDRHVDDHAMWINPNNSNHYLIGGDGGVYETFDNGANYDFKENLPITQFYRVNVDNTFPFYWVYGGTQDNNSLGAPSQTIKEAGIENSDWVFTNGGDGFWTAIDPENSDIVYAESQYGGMVRFDKKSGEALTIRPEPGKGEMTYRWNWDAPLIISPHKHTRLYCAANKVFRSDDRGYTWEVISDDLTAQIDRNTFPVMGKYWSIDALAKDVSTSQFGTIVSFDESSLRENLLYAGTDDGLLQVSEDAKTWTKISSFPGIPEYTYVSDIRASKFDENVVFVAFNNIKRDDFKPYLLKSNDKGKTWVSIASDLPQNGTVHSIEQDFENPDLLFVGTEFGFFASTNGGGNWIQLKNGLPTIAVKDIALQKREHDIAIATFGRGIYILDDYRAMRLLSKKTADSAAIIFPIPDALMYLPVGEGASLGQSHYKAPNPKFGATITYYLKEVPKTLKDIRKEKEKELFKEGKPIPQPTDSMLAEEKRELAPYLIFSVADESGMVIRRITAPASKGVNRIYWDLKHQSVLPQAITDSFNPLKETSGGVLAMPGNYTVSMMLVDRTGMKDLLSGVPLKAEVLRNTTLPAADRQALVAFQKKASQLMQRIDAAHRFTLDMKKRTENLKQTLLATPSAPITLLSRIDALALSIEQLLGKFVKQTNKPSFEETPPHHPALMTRLETLVWTHWASTSGITRNEEVAYEVLMEEFPPVLQEMQRLFNTELKVIESQLDSHQAPWTPGRMPQEP